MKKSIVEIRLLTDIVVGDRLENENTGEVLIQFTTKSMEDLLRELTTLQRYYQDNRRREQTLSQIGNRISDGIGEGIIDERDRMIARDPGFDSIFRGTYNAPTIHWTPDTWVEEW